MKKDYIKKLNSEEVEILVNKGTEKPFSGKYNDFYEKAQDYKLWLDCAFRSYSFGLIQVPLLFYSAKSSSLTVKKQLMFALKARFSVLSISRPFFSLSLLLGMLYDLKNLLIIWFKPL